MTDLFNSKDNAFFSSDRVHRIWLARIWDDEKPKIMFIGLNPSTANETSNDPTIRRVQSMAKGWGYGGVYIMNLFTYISTDPKKLNISIGNVHNANDWLIDTGSKCGEIVFAWGNFNVFGRDKEVMSMFPNAKALHINKNGSPKHPLYCRSNSQLVTFKTNK